ncbi:hypothetical protein KM043_001881 [Ampulex compressa]|nr:hypothetical protein KM043_001881 [Ampulex compressa]
MKKKPRKTRRQLLAERVATATQLINRANALDNPLERLCLFHKYMTADNDVIELSCITAKNAHEEQLSRIFDLMERNMKHLYEQSQWGWDFSAKQCELTEQDVRFLIAMSNEKFLGFSHFRFVIDDGDEVLYCYELQLEPLARRKGLGRFIMAALESMAIENKMKRVVLTVFKHNPSAMQFFHALGYKLDKSSPPACYQCDYVILSKWNIHS